MKPTPLSELELKYFKCSTCEGKQISIYLKDNESYPYCKNCYNINMERAHPEQSEQFKLATKRAEQIVQSCHYSTDAHCPESQQAYSLIDDIFNALTQELSLTLPSNFRTQNVLQSLEEACMWAKKAVAVYYSETSKNDAKTNNTH